MRDRRVLVVAAPEFAAFGCDGVGSFASVQDAVDAVPLNNQVRTIIRIAPGVHRHRVHISTYSQDQELHHLVWISNKGHRDLLGQCGYSDQTYAGSASSGWPPS